MRYQDVVAGFEYAAARWISKRPNHGKVGHGIRRFKASGVVLKAEVYRATEKKHVTLDNGSTAYRVFDTEYEWRNVVYGNRNSARVFGWFFDEDGRAVPAIVTADLLVSTWAVQQDKIEEDKRIRAAAEKRQQERAERKEAIRKRGLAKGVEVRLLKYTDTVYLSVEEFDKLLARLPDVAQV